MGTNVATGVLDAVEIGDALTCAGTSAGLSRINFTLSGVFVATVRLERSFDGTNWFPVAKPDLTDASFTAPISLMIEEPEAGTRYRANCTAFTSGSATYRFSQT